VHRTVAVGPVPGLRLTSGLGVVKTLVKRWRIVVPALIALAVFQAGLELILLAAGPTWRTTLALEPLDGLPLDHVEASGEKPCPECASMDQLAHATDADSKFLSDIGHTHDFPRCHVQTLPDGRRGSNDFYKDTH
jgi:hypothetical protein